MALPTVRISQGVTNCPHGRKQCSCTGWWKLNMQIVSWRRREIAYCYAI